MAMTLLDRVRQIIRLKHFSIRTEDAYVYWIRRFIIFHNKIHPIKLSEPDVAKFLTFLAVDEQVAASTQNVALSAIIFLYRNVLGRELNELTGVMRSKRPERIPVVFSRGEIRLVLENLKGTNHLMASLLYGAGLRLMECVRLRVKDIDFNYNQITIRAGKGDKDRVTMLPKLLIEPLKRQIAKVKFLHNEDLYEGFGEVYLPNALEKKYPNASKELAWQYLFPSQKRSIDPQLKQGSEIRDQGSEKEFSESDSIICSDCYLSRS